MIKEMAMSATLVAVLASLPYLFSPLQVVIGSYADRHPVLGFRRTPYILLGLLLCVLGVILAPQAVFLMAEQPALGLALSALTFGAWGMGFNVASVSYLSLASELSEEKGRSRTISIMWFVMILGIILTAAALSRMLAQYSHETLQAAFQVIGLAALVLGGLGLIRLEPRGISEPRLAQPARRASWQALTGAVLSNPIARSFFLYMIILLAAILGQDVLLEPFAGEAFGLPVAATTRITSIWGGCVLLTLLAAGWMERRFEKRTVARLGAVIAIAGFLTIVTSGLLALVNVFYMGVVLLGLGTGFSTVSNLSLMLDMTTKEVGLYIGAWGMADALARLLGAVMSGAVRDLVTFISRNAVLGYVTVFFLHAVLLILSLVLLARIDPGRFRRQAELTTTERAALMNETSG
jgi:BCD family chlorophyll transporter-like MFS transporter